MLIRITESQKTYSVTLKVWEDNQYSPDCFDDLEVNVPRNRPEVDGAYEMPQKDFDGLVGYWKSECEDFNEGRWSEQFGDPNEPGRDAELALFVDEI